VRLRSAGEDGRNRAPTAGSASIDYTQTLADHGVLASVASVGDAYDSPLPESFVDSFKTELIADRVWRTCNQLELAVVEYLGWFNNARLHQALGDVPPAEFEALSPRRDETIHPQSRLGNHLTGSPRNPGRLTASSGVLLGTSRLAALSRQGGRDEPTYSGTTTSRRGRYSPTLAGMHQRLVLLLLALVVLLAPMSVTSPASAQDVPACDDEIDNDGDGLVDWWEDPDCHDDPERQSEAPAICDDGLDNDTDGRIDREDPGCRGKATGTDETDPPPVPATFKFTVLRPWGCGITTGVEVLPDLTPKRLFPFADVTVAVRGLTGPARAIDRRRQLPLSVDPGYGFDRLRPGRYEVTGQYLGDPFRLATTPITRRITLSRARCRTYFSGSGRRRYKPRVLYFGASQRIYDVSWRRWGRKVARGRGTFPANDCIPYCAAGTITPYRVAVKLSRPRICNGFIQYLTLRWTYRNGQPPGAPRSQSTTFDYTC
jgi:putative transposase